MPTTDISVVIAAYNEGQFLREQLNAILPQLTPTDQLVLVNDGSTDKTCDFMWEAVQKRAEKKTLLVFHETPSGACQAFGIGVGKGTEEWVYCASGNDVMCAGALDALRRGIRQDVGIVCGHCHDEPGLGWPEGKLSQEQMVAEWQVDHIHGCATLIRRDLWGEGFRPDLGSFSDTWLFHNTAFRHGLAYVPVRIARVREHERCHADTRDYAARRHVIAKVDDLLMLAENNDIRPLWYGTMLMRVVRGNPPK